MNSTTTTEDLEIPILPNKSSSRKSGRRRWFCFWTSSRDDEVTDPEAAQRFRINCLQHLLGMSMICSLGFLFLFSLYTSGTDMAFDKPEIKLDSVYVCQVSSSNSKNPPFMIWDLKFDITNTDKNHTLCIPQFEVSVFSSSSYNRTTPFLLAKTAITPTHTCVGSTNHTSALGLVEEEEDSFQTNVTFRFDLKIHAQFYFDKRYFPYVGDLVCKDAEVAFSTSNSNSSSCGCLVGDPFQCYYESYE